IGFETHTLHFSDARNVDDIAGSGAVSQGRVEIGSAGKNLAAVRGQGVDRFCKRPRLKIQGGQSPRSEPVGARVGQRRAVNFYTSDDGLYRTVSTAFLRWRLTSNWPWFRPTWRGPRGGRDRRGDWARGLRCHRSEFRSN